MARIPSLVAVALLTTLAALAVLGCGATAAPSNAPLDRCAATSTYLRGLEPACWYGDAGAADAR